jgi:hypothetical protein
MNRKKLIVTVCKLIALVIVLFIGIPFVIHGYQMLQEKPSPEKPITFIADMRPRTGPSVGTVTVKFEPTEAFIIGDKISADIEVDVNSLQMNETANVYFTFLDCLSTDEEWAWTNSSHYNEMIFPEFNYSMPTYSVYKARAFVWFTHEGIFGANVTVYSLYSEELLALPSASLDGTVYWNFPEMIHIKSYDYVEQRANAQFINALTVEILGWAIIAVSPMAITVVSLGERLYDSITEKQSNRQMTEPQGKNS